MSLAGSLKSRAGQTIARMPPALQRGEIFFLILVMVSFEPVQIWMKKAKIGKKMISVTHSIISLVLFVALFRLVITIYLKKN